jgi:phage repressor protein C with HTH and peptisase S24 domain
MQPAPKSRPRSAPAVHAEPSKTDQNLGEVVSPSTITDEPDAIYLIDVTGDALAPVHKSGSTALVNPHLPPKEGGTCVFRRHTDGETVEIIFAELRRFNDQAWYVQQYKPKKNFSLKRSDWKCSVTIGNYF